MQFFHEELFAVFNDYLCFLPNLIDDIFYRTTDIFGKEVSNGYVYSAVVLTALCILCHKLDNILDKKRTDFLADLEEKQANITIKKPQQKVRKHSSTELLKYNTFYGLLELKLKYYDETVDRSAEETRLTVEYSKLLVKKLQEKYPSVKFSANDKVFFCCQGFINFDSFLTDLIKVYKMIFNINDKHQIKTSYLLSFWIAEINYQPENALRFLLKINALNHINKVIISNKFTKRYDMLEERRYDYSGLGESKLLATKKDEDDFDINLFYLKKKEY